MYEAILDFWFNEIKPAQWWKEDADFDQLITERYSDIHTQASRCELFEWRKTPQGRLAEIIVLDQFSRNMFRDTPQAFAYDPLALALAQEAVAIKADDALNQTERSFLYMPFMHSESLTIHQSVQTLYQGKASSSNQNFEARHREIIERFGRYPHRNAILKRTSTAKDIEFLKQPGSGF